MLDGNSEVKTSAGRREGYPLKTGERRSTASRYPIFVSSEKRLTAIEDLRNGKLSDFVYRKKRIRHQFQRGNRFPDEIFVSADRHPTNFHSRQCKQLRESV